MLRAPRCITLLVVGFALTLLPSGSPAAEGEELSPATQQLLEERKLKKLHRKNAAEAIRALDRLRSDEDAETVDTAIAEVALEGARKAAPAEARGLYLSAAAAVWKAALTQAAAMEGRALDLYGEAASGLIDALQGAPSEALRGGTDEIDGPLVRWELAWVDAGPEWTPATHHFRPASEKLSKKSALEPREGLGAALVAVARTAGEEEEAEPEEGLFEIYRYYYPLTAVLELGPESAEGTGDRSRSAVVRLLDPRLTETHEIAGAEYQLAIDIGAQFATLKREVDAIFAKKGLLQAGKYMSVTSLYIAEPLRPGKIPLVLTHGLASSPVTWGPAGSEFLSEPEIRRSYQFWVFAYPTGIAFPFPGVLLRESLVEAMRRLDEVGESPASDRMVMMGHSMGGLLTRLQVTDSGMTLWDAVFSEPPEELDLSPKDLERITDVLILEPLPFVERVVFCSTPHRGSKFAANAAGKLGATLVRLPKELLDLSRRLALTAGEALVGEAAERRKIADSVQSLQPRNPFLVALDTLPIDSRVTYHSLIGDRGKGDTPDSSDGVVPYWSSHLEGAASEKIVPSGHSSHQHPEGIDELRRILLLHLEEYD